LKGSNPTSMFEFCWSVRLRSDCANEFQTLSACLRRYNRDGAVNILRGQSGVRPMGPCFALSSIDLLRLSRQREDALRRINLLNQGNLSYDRSATRCEVYRWTRFRVCLPVNVSMRGQIPRFWKPGLVTRSNCYTNQLPVEVTRERCVRASLS